MAVVPHSIDIVVADLAASLEFYRSLGLPIPDGQEDEQQVQIDTPGGASIGLFTEATIKEHDPHWQQPVGQRVTFACQCDGAAELDAVYARVVAAGHEGRQAPWDTRWGQRYATLADPDGNRVDLFSAQAGDVPA